MAIVASMIVRNEAHNSYFVKVLTSITDAVDYVMILDDKSDDGGATRSVCRSFPNILFRESPFDVPMYPINEPKFREVQWQKTCEIAKDGDWILALDADEEIEKSFTLKVKELMASEHDWFRFRLLDMWSPTTYRVDGYWSPVKEVFFRYKNLPAELPTAVNHVPLLPKYIVDSANGTERRDIKIIHWGWANEDKRLAKQQFYLDGRADGVNLEHAKSITTPATVEEYVNEN